MKNFKNEKKVENWVDQETIGNYSGVMPGCSGYMIPWKYNSFFTYKKEKTSNCLSCGTLVADKCEYCGRYSSPYGIY